jgi:hypothetical protein
LFQFQINLNLSSTLNSFQISTLQLADKLCHSPLLTLGGLEPFPALLIYQASSPAEGSIFFFSCVLHQTAHSSSAIVTAEQAPTRRCSNTAEQAPTRRCFMQPFYGILMFSPSRLSSSHRSTPLAMLHCLPGYEVHVLG